MPRNAAPKKLESLSLTELRARYREVVGEETRSPNKKYLIRRIEECLAVKKQRSPARRGAATAPSAPPPTPPARATPSSEETTPPSRQRGRFGTMSLQELQAEYRKVVGRPTGSSNVSYLQWKIREAEAGRVSVGPRPEREVKVREDGKRVIPLSFDAEALEALDKAWRDAGLPSRTRFFRQAVHHELTAMGATEAAALFAPEEA
ncbi:DUF2924 domain-containing protein [Myxococcus sp. K15C18031901]|uniref:DUF2924 domain-containing protein n=1 Tax=Myxococcus dinghuensis TaxID=2906761 RepID=UPI0020A6FE89|nr:DUF2924 domain-containing protein [Myxococcus dinghuensis]MCP3104541.1 DUF2924 domain-containing protein [Myxococcus dinghuensis]